MSPLEIVGIAAAVVGGLAAVVQVLLQWRERRERVREARASPVPSAEQLAAWRSALRLAVVERRVRVQLEETVRREEAIDLRARQRPGPDPRDWGGLCEEWARAPDRMLLSGEPGYGKTVSALLLLERVNQDAAPDAPVAELFSLAEWQGRRAELRRGRLDRWLAEQLSSTYPWLSPEASRALVAAGAVLPLLDGLDELAAAERADCAAAIEAYAGRGAVLRPFVLTCRAEECRELGDGALRVDRRVELPGLEPDQVASLIGQSAGAGSGWTQVRRRVEAGDPDLLGVFRSPLRLSVALEAYRDDPADLLSLPAAEIEGRLWDELLGRDDPEFRGAGSERIRAWLSFLATAMAAHRKQRLRLHELPALVPDAETELRRFARRMRVGGRLAFVAAGAVLGSIAYLALRGSEDWFFEGAVGGAGLALLGLLFAVAAGERLGRLASWKVSAPAFRSRLRLTRGEFAGWAGASLFTGLLYGIPAGLHEDLRNGLLFFVAFGGIALLGLGAWHVMDAWWDPSTEVADEVPADLAGRGPDAVYLAARDEGIAAGCLGALAGLLCGLFIGVGGGLAVAVGTGLVLALGAGVLVGLESGCWAWLYHLWLCRRLARRGLVPRHLKDFLDWCSAPERGWLRASDAYEFRHRGLMEHLAGADLDGSRQADR